MLRAIPTRGRKHPSLRQVLQRRIADDLTTVGTDERIHRTTARDLPQSQKHEVDTWMLRRAAVDARRRLPKLDDPNPSTLLAQRKLPSQLTALRALHVPASKQHAEKGRDRQAYEELLRSQLALGVLRNAQAAEVGIAHKPTGRLLDAWLAGLPYTHRCTAAGDSRYPHRHDRLRPMNRLLQGDVGAGKAPALAATAFALLVIEGGFQAVLMAPTDILARRNTSKRSPKHYGLSA